MAEKSKVVYLSYLPLNTIQADINSFLSAAGTRPIVLWTLTLGSGLATETGFAVFATHEEVFQISPPFLAKRTISKQAARSLSLDGHPLPPIFFRIRVVPSSARVLERGHEVLVPFPVDWPCGCGFRNPPGYRNCGNCRLQRYASEQHNNDGSGDTHVFDGGRGNGFAGGSRGNGLVAGFTGSAAFDGGSLGNNAFSHGFRGDLAGNNAFGGGTRMDSAEIQKKMAFPADSEAVEPDRATNITEIADILGDGVG